MVAEAAARRAVRAARRGGERIGDRLLAPPHGPWRRVPTLAPADSRRVALTFDDGPSRPGTERLLDVLGELGVPATFFCVGSMVARHPEVVRRAHDEGHRIASHSMRHQRRPGLLPGRGRHLDEAADEIEGAIGMPPALYRPPWGWLTPWERRRLVTRALTPVGWDVSPQDWDPAVSAEALTARIMESVRPGSIILLHDGIVGADAPERTATIGAVRAVVPQLRSAGCQFVTVDELLGPGPVTAGTAAAP